MADQALYRKYRSASFDQVLGQQHIVDSLSGALKAGNISHAYLFTGPRGTGKTSVARLLAHELNSEAGDAANFDIVEIDAASNRSIDSIRDLREKVNLAPSVGKYKVYIIDEVHMLTTEAFNALLKTLEEPPAHVIFILATTEAQKLPETIISRTQRFAFRPIPAPTIATHLATIAAAEGFSAEPEALELIARLARGGFRDAISLLDQVASSGEPVTLERVQRLLGFTDSSTMARLAEALLAGQTSEVLAIIDRLKSEGISAAQLIAQLIDWWRALLGRSVAGETKVPLGTISQVLELLIEAAKSPYPELSLEVALVKLTLNDDHPSPVATTTKSSTATTPAAASDPKMADRWPKVLASVKRANPNVYTVIQMSEAHFSSDNVTLRVRVRFHRDQLVKQQHRQIIEEAMARVYGRKVGLVVEVEAAAKAAKAEVKDDLVSSALEILGGEIVE